VQEKQKIGERAMKSEEQHKCEPICQLIGCENIVKLPRNKFMEIIDVARQQEHDRMVEQFKQDYGHMKFREKQAYEQGRKDGTSYCMRCGRIVTEDFFKIEQN
jgi:hypothetical protein